MSQLARLPGLTKADRDITHLDVGCGTGAAVQFINDHCRGVHSYGIDPGLPRDEPPLFRASLENLESVKALPPSFDVISFLDVLEHFEAPGPALQQARVKLSSGGLLLIKVPTRSGLIYQEAKHLRYIVPGLSRKILRRLYQVDYRPPHYWFFDLESLRALLDDAGFVVERHEYVTEIPVAHLWQRLWGMRLPVRMAAFVCLLPLKLFATGPRAECLAVVARAKTKD